MLSFESSLDMCAGLSNPVVIMILTDDKVSLPPVIGSRVDIIKISKGRWGAEEHSRGNNP